MNAFDKVIGYEAIKAELVQICDMIHNRKIYEDLGARLPKGVILSGDPGLGKSLLSNCFIEESGLKAYTVRKNKGRSHFIGEITNAFDEAKKNAPAIVFLDDMDKFANEDLRHKDADEYVAVQAGIDDVKNCDVFVIATVNDIDKLPESLVRPGRFDRKIEMGSPEGDEAARIIKHYLSNKKVSEGVNMEDLTRMISYSSCAELETIINEAAVSAAYKRRNEVEMDDLIGAVLRMQYHAPENEKHLSTEVIKRNSLHEAGHMVVSEVLEPESIGLVSIRSSEHYGLGGFTHRCKDVSRSSYEIMIALAGKAAVEMYYPGETADGCVSDINSAEGIIRYNMASLASRGFGFYKVRVDGEVSESLSSRIENATQAELEKYMMLTRDILMQNREFLESAAAALAEKETLLFSDIRSLRERFYPAKASA